MINKIYKRIHNKYSTLFKFIFFLRYLFGIFLISAVIFLLIPHFFDLKKKEKIIKNYLLESYGLKLNNYDNIKYNSLPKPNLEIQNVNLNIEKETIPINVKTLTIYPKLYYIYNYEDFEATKIILSKNKILLSDTNLKIFINYIHNLKNKINFENLNLAINRNDSLLFTLRKIYFSNYGHNKNIIRGELFNKKFKVSMSDDYDNLNFKLLKTGIAMDIVFNQNKKNSIIKGVFKTKFLNSKLKFNFDYDDQKLKIYNSYFRNNDLSFNNESLIIHSPFFFIDSIFKIEDINIKIFKDISLNKILSFDNIIKKLNTKNEINFKSKRFSNNLIDDLDLNVDLAYGRLTYSKKISISNSLFKCQGDVNLLKEYPILYFNCSITSKDKKKLLKKLSINYKNKNKSFLLNAEGNINLLNKKINFKNISADQNYEATKEDLIYFKRSFEAILFNKNFIGIFNLRKIKEFIIEIS
jgi:hypothetical protein